MNVPMPDEVNKHVDQVEMSLAAPVDFSRLSDPIRRLAERVARQRQAEISGKSADSSLGEEETRIFAKGL